MKKHLPKLCVVLLFFFFINARSQTSLSHEFGVNLGVSSFQPDFGLSTEFASANQSNLAYGFSYYMKFFGSKYNWRSGSTFFSEHFKMKLDFSYVNNSNINHDAIKNASDQLKAMTGTIKLYNAGLNFEYYFLKLEDYSSFYKSSGTINPFISLGLGYSYSQPDILVNGVSLKGYDEPYDGNGSPELIPKWQEGAVHLNPENIFSARAGAGVRFGLDMLDFSLEAGYNYYFSDVVDGLNAPDDPANKGNDSMVSVTIGVIYVFGKY